MRINKYIALHMGLSRREADDHIVQGKVSINNVVAEIGAQVKDHDIVTVDGTPVGAVANTYLILHKPVGYVCSRKSQGGAPTIYNLLPAEYRSLKLVGRLDKDSSGIILLTNDGDFAHRMTHPSFHKTKIYEVQLNKSLQPLHQQMISDFGVMLEDGKSQFTVSKSVTEAKGGRGVEQEDTATYQITMTEGRNRQIRRTFAALGYTVTALHRTHFGPYQLADLQSASYQEIAI